MFIGVVPRPPGYGGRPPGKWAISSGGAKTRLSGLSCLGSTGPCPVRSLKVSALYGHRLVWQNCGSWSVIGHALPPDHRRTQQVGRHQAACNRNISLQILMAKGPSGPRIGRKQILILPAGVYQKPEVARSRKNGVQGWRLGTPAPRGVPRSHTPWCLFGSFLGKQKGTLVPLK